MPACRRPVTFRTVRWRTLLTPPMDGPDNMALDVALMERARATGEAVLRVYGWRAPTLSLGRHQAARGAYDLAPGRGRGGPFVRPPPRGGAGLHHREGTD